MAYNSFIPMYIDRVEARRTRDLITAEDWNELFNLNIAQGDHSEEYLSELSEYLFGTSDDGIFHDIQVSLDELAAKDAFVAVYNSTPASEIYAAVQAGRPVYMRRASTIYALFYCTSNNAVFINFVHSSGSQTPVIMNISRVVVSTWSSDPQITLTTLNEYNTLAATIATKQNTLVSGTNIKTIDGKSILGSGDLSIVFPVEYGVTTAAEIDAAYQEGQICFVVKDNLYYSLYSRNIDGTHFTFVAFGSTFAYSVSCNGSTWTSGYVRLATYTELTNGLAGKQDVLTFDNVPTGGSANPVKSGGVYNALQVVSEKAAPAILNTASGAVCSFPDGSVSPMTSVIAEIVASQAGSGTPYPAGGGKNKFPDGTVSFTRYGSYACVLPAGTYTISAIVTSSDTDESTSRVSVQDASNNELAVVYLSRNTRTSQTFTIASDAAKVVLYAARTSGSSTGDTATWTDVQIESGSTATDYAPYSNIRPITGYTGANVTRAGRNILPNIATSKTQNNVTFTVNSDGSVTVVTSGAASANTFLNLDYVGDFASAVARVATGVDITASGMTSDVLMGIGFFDADGNTAAIGNYSATQTFQYPSNAVKGRTYLRVNSGKNIPTPITIYPQFEFGSTAHDYEPYAGEVVSVSWQDEAGTVYFGYIDLVSGTLTVTHKGIDLGTLAWTQATSGSVVYFRAVQADKAYGLDNILCSCYQQGTAYVSSTPDCTIAGRASSREVIVKDSTKAAMTAEEFSTAVSGQTLVYELTTAETYTLSGQIIEALYGDNTLWNSVGGNTTAKYRADTKLYIQGLIAALNE